MRKVVFSSVFLFLIKEINDFPSVTGLQIYFDTKEEAKELFGTGKKEEMEMNRSQPSCLLFPSLFE